MNYTIGTKDSVIAYEWFTEPPTEPGWYQAIREGEEPEYVKVVNDYFSLNDDTLQVIETGKDYNTDIGVFVWWLGPVPLADPPTVTNLQPQDKK